ncbi:MAG: ROK family transcriptional regulator [Firmicutes bacterium]|nr:ROK family transcriptional regulator [Bacillota bacterium]
MKPKRTADSALAKKLNRAVVIDCIEKYGALSRADIARLTMLSPSTVSSIVAELVDLGIVRESKGTAASSGGRRPILLDLNSSASCAAVVDVQVSRVLYGVVDLAGKPIWTAKEEVDLSSPEATFHQVFQIVAKTLAKLPRTGAPAAGIGVSIPGIVDTTTGTVIKSTRLKWKELPLANRLQQEFSLPVYVDRDVRAAAWGERSYGLARSADDFVYVMVGKGGLGAGLILGGRSYVGARMQAGELGHMTVDINGEECSCGNTGCLVTLTYPAIDEVRRNNEKDPIIDCAAIGILNLMNLLDPELVVLGGDIGQEPAFVAQVEKVVQERTFLTPRKNVRLVASQLGEIGIVLGLAGLVFDKFYWKRAFENVG